MPLRPFRRRVSATDGDLVIRKPPPVVRRHSSVEVASPQLPPIPKVSPLLNANEQDRLTQSDDSTTASSRYSGGSSLLASTSDGAATRRRYASADEGTVLTTASSIEEEADKLSPSPFIAPQLAMPMQAKGTVPDTLRDAWFASPALAPAPRQPVTLPDEEDNDADEDSEEDGIVYVDDESSDEEEPLAAAGLEDDLVLTCGCDGTAANRLPPPIFVPDGQLPWMLPRRGTDDSGAGPAASAIEEDENDPTLLEAERILLTTPEPLERSSAIASPRSDSLVGPTRRPSLPLPGLPSPTLARHVNDTLDHATGSHGAIERGLERLVLAGDSDSNGDGDETEVEAARRRTPPSRVALASAPARPARKRPNKLQKRRRSVPAGVSEDEGSPKKPPFDRFSFPSEEGLAAALDCEIATESGEKIKFGDMLRQRSRDKVVVM